jgi:hypothetical protein
MRETLNMSTCRTLGLALAVGLLTAGAAAAGYEDCLVCHTGGVLGDPRMDVDEARYGASIHGLIGISCTDCHSALAGVTDFPHEPSGRPDCSMCHADASEAIERAAHRSGTPDAPNCWTCHGGHDVAPVSDEASRVAPLNQPSTCLACHADASLAGAHGMQVREPGEAFELSVHYQALKEGNPAAPTCTTCHGAHDNLSHNDPASPIARANVADTCGMCHGDVGEKFARGVHGTELAAGDPNVPTCTGCHAEHAIRAHDDPASPVFAANIARTCSHCHDDETLTAQYGLASARMRTFMGSFHGVANRFGQITVANCASCHGAHDILPSTNAHSRIHPSNLQATCGSCHPQAGANFATGKIHVQDTREDNFWAWLVKRLYLTMISGVIGMFAIFIAVDLWWRWRTGRSEGRSA